MGKRIDQKEATRGRILRAALSAFNAYGYHGASTRAITAEAKVSPGLLFHYFPTKDALYTALVQIGLREVQVDADRARRAPLAFFSSTAAHVIGLLREWRETADMFAFMSYVGTHPGLVAEADDLMAENDILLQIIPVLEEGQRRGEIRQGTPEALAVAYWGALQGIAMEVAANRDAPLPDPDWIVDIVRERSGS